MTVEFRLLGPIEVTLDGTVVAIGPRQQAILALLVMDANRLVTLDQILDRVWDVKRPVRPANAVQTQVTLLRRALPGVTITWQTGGYRLTTDEQNVDLHRFHHEADLARGAADDEQAVRHWHAAIELWRGEPFAGIELPWFSTTRGKLLAELDAARLDHLDARLRRGEHDAVLPELRANAAQHPLDERIAGQLIRALRAAGRPDEAQRHYETIRDRLADELGTDPSPALQHSHAARTSLVPRQLPPAPSSFTGRADELAVMTKLLDDATETGGTVVISAIAGTGGIGKTWLSLHWAHQHRERFPDGQLFIDLRGFSPDNQPVAAGNAAQSLLEALDIAHDQIPASLDTRFALLRTLLADKRMLLVLDNAANAEQVLPLLPGSSTNTVLINSRDRLSGLSTGHGAHRVMLDVLTADEARELLETRLGAERLAEEPDAVAELLAQCGGFPLALSIIAGQALSHPDFPLAALAADLREHRLLALDDAEQTASLPAVLSWSYTALTKDRARAFGLLGIAPGPDISLGAAASLLDRSEPETRRLLRALERASLLHEHAPGRYRMHDLVRAYAREESAAETQPALRRIIDFYLHTANAIAERTSATYQNTELFPIVAGVRPRTFAGIDEGATWLAEEYQNLSAAPHETDAQGWDQLTWQLVGAITPYRTRTARLLEGLAAWQLALAATVRRGDRIAEAIARRCIANVHARGGQFDDAYAEVTESIRIAVACGDRRTELLSETMYGIVCDVHKRFADAEPHMARALAIAEEDGNPLWMSMALTNVAWFAANRGRFDRAFPLAKSAAELHRTHQSDNRAGLGNILHCLGFISNGMGDHRQAIDYYRQALVEFAAHDSVYYDVETLENLGHPYRALGQLDKADEVWQQALRACREQHRSTDAARIEGLLAELSGVAVE